jgi:hypothetical protein
MGSRTTRGHSSSFPLRGPTKGNKSWTKTKTKTSPSGSRPALQRTSLTLFEDEVREELGSAHVLREGEEGAEAGAEVAGRLVQLVPRAAQVMRTLKNIQGQ